MTDCNILTSLGFKSTILCFLKEYLTTPYLVLYLDTRCSGIFSIGTISRGLYGLECRGYFVWLVVPKGLYGSLGFLLCWRGNTIWLILPTTINARTSLVKE